jgi:acetolactate synthase I/II/III large subunit
LTKIRVVDYIVQHLAEIGVDTAFLLNGGGMMHLVDSVGSHPGIRVVCNHHEQASAIAADGYSRISGKIGFCCATSGPGGTNILTGLVGAWQDSSKVLFLTGQSKLNDTIANTGIEGLRQCGTFEVDIVPIVQSVTKYAAMVVDANEIKFHLEKALFLMREGRPGPALLDLPLDIQGTLINPETLKGFVSPSTKNGTKDRGDLNEVCNALKESCRPLFLVGNGVRIAGAVSEFHDLIEFLGVPVVTTQVGKDSLHYNHPLFVGHCGPKGCRAGNFAIQNADLIISLGCSLHAQTIGWESDLFAPAAKKIQVDIDPALLQLNRTQIDFKIKMCAFEFIVSAIKYLEPKACDAWKIRCSSWKARYPVISESHVETTSNINLYRFIDSLSKVAPATSRFISDAGSAFYVTGQALLIKKGQRFISSGSLGAMGFALPAACGAACFDREQVNICVTGDGSLMTNLHELATAKYNKFNLKLFVINNGGYVSMRNTQNSFFNGNLVGADSTSGVFIPEIGELAKSFELPYVRISSSKELEDRIREVLIIDGPVMVEVMCNVDQKIIPSVTSKKLDDGRMASMALHEMAPQLPDDILEQEMIDS